MSGTYQETLDVTYRLLNAVGMLTNNPELLQDTLALTERINVAVRLEMDSTAEALNAKKDALAIVCRRVKGELGELLKDKFLWENTTASLTNEVNRLTLAHRLVAQSKPTIRDFPTQAEVDAWQRKEQAAMAMFQDKRRELSEHQQNMNLWSADVAYKQAELNKHVGEYADVYKRLNALLGLPADEDNTSSNSFSMK